MKLKYVLTLLACVPAGMGWALAESETNNARFEANGPFTFPQVITGNFQNDGAPLGPEDFFQFTATSGAGYSFVISVTNPAAFAPLDPGLEIQSGAGTTLVQRDVNGDNVGETLTWTAPSTGTFYLIAFEGTGNPNGVAGYSISASQTSAVTDWELY